MVPPQQVTQFEDEMTRLKADWQVHVFGNTKHAFANPEANDAALGTVYNPLSDKRAWMLMKTFFNEIFAEKNYSNLPPAEVNCQRTRSFTGGFTANAA